MAPAKNKNKKKRKAPAGAIDSSSQTRKVKKTLVSNEKNTEAPEEMTDEEKAWRDLWREAPTKVCFLVSNENLFLFYNSCSKTPR
jgi:hypothetical protein